MNLSDLFEETFFALFSNKVRSGLTILGIIIGIGSVVATLSIGQGVSNSIQSNIASIGSNLIMVTPGAQQSGLVRQSAGSATTLTLDDANAVQSQITGAQYVAPQISRSYQAVAGGNNENVQVIGTTPDYANIRSLNMLYGSFITNSQVTAIDPVAVLGPTTSDNLFGQGVDPVGKTVKINNVIFTVVGVTYPKGSSGFVNQDDMIVIPVTVAQHYLSGGNNVSSITIQAPNQQSIPLIQQEVTDLLLQRHNISNPQNADFTVTNEADIIATVSSITTTFTIFLASIAGISLLVGGIGIMNMMLTTVTERTREIGLRKAIGAKSRDITMQFLIEAALLTVIGGILGIIFGAAISALLSKFASVTTQVSAFSVALSFGVSAAIGLIFGYYPAKKAAQLSPIEALRYE
jgi:putative ABC transport system permease protein